MRPTLLAALVLGIALGAAGCKPAPDPDADRVPAPQAPLRAAHAGAGPAPATPQLPAAAPVNAPGTDAVVVADLTSPGQMDPGFDARGFAGTFTAPGTRLVIEPDGRYALDGGAGPNTGS